MGHLTIGAGAVDYQDLVRINMAMGDGSICKQQAFVDAFAKAPRAPAASTCGGC